MVILGHGAPAVLPVKITYMAQWQFSNMHLCLRKSETLLQEQQYHLVLMPIGLAASMVVEHARSLAG